MRDSELYFSISETLSTAPVLCLPGPLHFMQTQLEEPEGRIAFIQELFLGYFKLLTTWHTDIKRIILGIVSIVLLLVFPDQY